MSNIGESISRRVNAVCAVALISSCCDWSRAAETTAPPATPAIVAPPAGAYKLDKAHASLVLRANHMGFSTYTTRFSRFDAQLTFDPMHLSAAKVQTTIDASSFEMDAAPQMCLDIMKGPQMLDTSKYPLIVFQSESVRMTGARSMEVSGTLTLHGVTRRSSSQRRTTAAMPGCQTWTRRLALASPRTAPLNAPISESRLACRHRAPRWGSVI